MRNIIDKHYDLLRKDQGFIRVNLVDWYYGTTRHGNCNNLEYPIRRFIRDINTALHINLKYRISKGLSFYGKES